MFKKKKPQINLLDLIPFKKVNSEKDEKGLEIILRPKFVKGPFKKWLQPRLKRPYFKIHLDELGTSVWELIDGKRTVEQISALLRENLGEKIEPCEQRVCMFIQQLKSGDMIDYIFPENITH